MELLVPNELPIVVQPSVIKVFGRTPAEILCRLHYWLGRATKHREGKVWVYKTVEEWAEELGKCTKTIGEAISKLESKGVLVSRQFESSEWYHGKSYRIDYDKLYEIMGIEIKKEEPQPERVGEGIGESVPVDNSGKKLPIEDGKTLPFTTRKLPVDTPNVCMSSQGKGHGNFWNQDEDWALIKALGDNGIDPDSHEGITFGKITKKLKASAEQLRQALYSCFNSKVFVKNPFGLVYKILKDYLSGDNAYFNFHKNQVKKGTNSKPQQKFKIPKKQSLDELLGI